MAWPIIAVIILVLLIVFAVIAIKSEKKMEPDYRALFFLGITWFIIGIGADISVFFILGLVYMAMGLANRKRWGKKPRKLTRREREEQKTTKAILGFVLLLTVLAILFTLIMGIYF